MKRKPLVIGEAYALSPDSHHAKSIGNSKVRLMGRRGLFKQWALVRSYHNHKGYSYIELYVRTKHLLR